MHRVGHCRLGHCSGFLLGHIYRAFSKSKWWIFEAKGVLIGCPLSIIYVRSLPPSGLHLHLQLVEGHLLQGETAKLSDELMISPVSGLPCRRYFDNKYLIISLFSFTAADAQ